MASPLAATWKAVRAHVPLIRFRKGLGKIAESLKQETPIMGTQQPASPSHKVIKSQKVLEEWQLPANFYRPPLTEEEIEYINRGGPA